jgi:hypothetical protein
MITAEFDALAKRLTTKADAFERADLATSEGLGGLFEKARGWLADSPLAEHWEFPFAVVGGMLDLSQRLVPAFEGGEEAWSWYHRRVNEPIYAGVEAWEQSLAAWDLIWEEKLHAAEARGLRADGPITPALRKLAEIGPSGDPITPVGDVLLAVDSFEARNCDQIFRLTLGSHQSFEALLSGACFPDWSPAGQRFVVARKDQPGVAPSQLVAVGRDGSSGEPLLAQEVSGLAFPTWSSGGDRIAFTRTGRDNANAVYLLDLRGAFP